MRTLVIFIMVGTIVLLEQGSAAAPVDLESVGHLFPYVLSGSISAISSLEIGAFVVRALDAEKDPLKTTQTLCAYLQKASWAFGQAALGGTILWESYGTRPRRQQTTAHLTYIIVRAVSKVVLGQLGAATGAHLGTSWVCKTPSVADKAHVLLTASLAAAMVGTLAFLLW